MKKQRQKICAKLILSKILPDSIKLRYFSNIAMLETWRKKHNESYPIFRTRFELYNYLNSEILNNRQITYMEFGVYKGETIDYWSKINDHRESSFFGFDTFTGLPEKWTMFTGKMDAGTFDTGGKTPQINDSRVSFIKGLFQDTLPVFLKNISFTSQLVIHNDSDLYSSTLYTLTRCNDVIVKGTIIIFDEFSSILNEFRALEDYCSSYMIEYEVLGATNNCYGQVAIRIK